MDKDNNMYILVKKKKKVDNWGYRWDRGVGGVRREGGRTGGLGGLGERSMHL